jgi:hypothetical protein
MELGHSGCAAQMPIRSFVADHRVSEVRNRFLGPIESTVSGSAAGLVARLGNAGEEPAV